jgi:hypothetical protein
MLVSLRLLSSLSLASRRLPTLTLYTGTDCQLCDVAKGVLQDLGRDVDFELKEYNIRDDNLVDVKKWRRAYQYGECKEWKRAALEYVELYRTDRASLCSRSARTGQISLYCTWMGKVSKPRRRTLYPLNARRLLTSIML